MWKTDSDEKNIFAWHSEPTLFFLPSLIKLVFIQYLKGLLQLLWKSTSRRYLAETIVDADYANDLALFADKTSQAESLLHSLEKAAKEICRQNRANNALINKASSIPHQASHLSRK